jgi:hypothetical protein
MKPKIDAQPGFFSKEVRNKAVSLLACAALLGPPILSLACGQAGSTPDAIPVPTALATKEAESDKDVKIFKDPEIIGMALALSGCDLSDIGKQIISEHGLKSTILRSSVNFNGKSSMGWYDLNGLGDPSQWNTKFAVLYHPEQQQFLKLALGDSGAKDLLSEQDAITAISNVIAEPLPVQMGEVGIGVQTYSALEMKKYGTSAFAQWVRYKNGEVPLSSVEELNRQGFIFGYKMLKAGYLHTDPHLGNILQTPSGKTILIDWAEMQKVPFNNQSVGVLWGFYRNASREFKINIGFSGYKSLLRANKIVEDIPFPDQSFTTLATPVVGALSRYFLMGENGQVEGVIMPGRVSSLPKDLTGPKGEKLPASAFALDSEIGAAEGAGQVSQVWRLVGKVGSAGTRIALPILEGTAYFVGADMLMQAINPAENPVETIVTSYSDEARISNYQTELTAQTKLDDLFKPIFASKQLWANRFQSDQDNNLRPQLWAPYLMEEKALLEYYHDQPLPELARIRQEYRANIVKNLITNSLIGEKKLEISDPVIKNLPFSEQVFISATSVDQAGTTDNRLFVWTAVPETKNQNRIVILLEAATVKENGKDVWKTIQQGNESMTVKIQGKDRTVRFFQDQGNLKIVIAAAKK